MFTTRFPVSTSAGTETAAESAGVAARAAVKPSEVAETAANPWRTPLKKRAALNPQDPRESSTEFEGPVTDPPGLDTVECGSADPADGTHDLGRLDSGPLAVPLIKPTIQRITQTSMAMVGLHSRSMAV
jgi:hypothetical protein